MRLENKDEKLPYSERICLKKKVLEHLKKSEKNKKPIAIAINGKWGVGKTYFWKNNLAPSISTELKKYPIYTSVFGKKDERDIVQDLVTQFLRRENGAVNKLKEILNKLIAMVFRFKTGVAVNVDTSFIFKAFTKEDLQDAIICIDDFERLSDKIPPEDILGLICELKENKGCCVVVLYNDDKLFRDKQENSKTDKRKIFEEYKEKIFDFNFDFRPSTIEQVIAMGGHPVNINFPAYPYMKGILNLDHLIKESQVSLLQKHKKRQVQDINLRQLERTNLLYDELFEFLKLEKYPSDDFRKTYEYLLYPIIYAYHFDLYSDYFLLSSQRTTMNLLSPYSSIGEILRIWLPILKNAIKALTSNPSYTPDQTLRDQLFNFVSKIVEDTEFHLDFLHELQQTKDDIEQASIKFFLKHKSNIRAFPYLFGFRILCYAIEEDLPNSDAKGFCLRIVMQQYQNECLELLRQWCDTVYQYMDGKYLLTGCGEYFWIDYYTFTIPLKNAFESLDANLPQHKLIEKFPL